MKNVQDLVKELPTGPKPVWLHIGGKPIRFDSEDEAQRHEVARECSPGFFERVPAPEGATTDAPGGEPYTPEARPLSALSVSPADDPNELLRTRYLGRGGGLLLVGPTGIGKSSFEMQAAIMWALGKPHFGIMPRGKLRCLIVQAENDDGDLVEMRDGVLEGMIAAELITEDEAAEACARVLVVRDVVSVGAAVGATLDRLLTKHPADLLFLDPAFSYLGGDASNQKDVSTFLRTTINPVLLKHSVGIVIVHHSNKPLRGKEKADWQAGDMAYLGSGSAEWANWARAVLSIRSIGSHDVFELQAGKRGKRIGWMDDEGNRQTCRYIGHSARGICWREVSPGEVSMLTQTSKPGGAGAMHYSEHLPPALELARSQVWKLGTYKAELTRLTGITTDRTLSELVKLVGEQDGIGRGRYQVGTHPVYLIGPAAGVTEAVEANQRE